MPTAREWVSSRRWYEDQTEIHPENDELIGFVSNDTLDEQGTFSRYPQDPYYEGVPGAREWFYIDLTRQGVGTLEGLPDPGSPG